MNELQKVELSILQSFIDICEKLNLTYYLVCGSALGAVKYKGFIPWDDDIDVALPRRDYEIFISKAQEMLPKNLFLQNYKTEPLYYGLGSKIRNSNTAFIEKDIAKLDINHGVFIDVFPLDGYPTDKKEIKIFERQKKYFYRRRYVRLNPILHRDLGLTICSVLHRLFKVFSNTSYYVSQNEKLISAYDTQDSKIWCNHANSSKKIEYANKEQYGKGIICDFEGIKVRIPEKYDEYLTQKYGNWREDVLESQKVPPHPYKIIDLEKSYLKYLSKK